MQSEAHANLYRSLADITVRIKSALGEGDARALMGLTGERRDVIAKLDQGGLSKDTGLLDLIEETRDRVYEVLIHLENPGDLFRECVSVDASLSRYVV